MLMLPQKLAWVNKCSDYTATAAITIGVSFMMMADGGVEARLNGSI